MSTEFKLPELGENIEAGDVVSVLVSVGDRIEVDQPILELETDKATVEVPSSVSGVVQEVHIKEGDKASVGQVILTVNSETEANGQPAAESQQAASAAEETKATPAEEKPQAAAPAQTDPAKETAPQAVEFKLPDLGENIEAGDVVSVLVSVGDQIEEDQPVLELETDKATLEVPSSVGGVVKAIHVQAGEKASVGQVVLTIETTGGAAAEPAPAPEPAETEPEPAAEIDQAEEVQRTGTVTFKPSPIPAPTTIELTKTMSGAPSPARSQVQAAPNVRRLAREIGVDITQVQGSGPLGRVSMDDVKRHARQTSTSDGAQAAPAGGAVPTQALPDFSKWGQVRREPMSNIRRSTAEHLSYAWATIPHVTNFDKADIGELEKLRKRFASKAEEAGGKLTVTAILLKVVASALKRFPEFNASVDMQNREIVYKEYVHIGVAVDTDRGLLVPAIRNVDQKNILELAVELTKISEKARSGKLSLEEMQGCSFTVTNLGGIGGTNFTPIVNAPEVAILGVARGSYEPIYRDNGEFEPRLMLPLSLSYDHRLIDGAGAARFLRWLVQTLEEPFMMSLQGW